MFNIQKIIDNNLITVYFQVIISPIDILSFGVESFIRGIDPDTNEIIPPNILFKVAYEHGLSSSLEKICIKEIFKTFKPISLLNPRIMLHINISKSFIPEATKDKFLFTYSKEIGLDPTRIIIDINNVKLNPESINELTAFIDLHRKSGFYISIDDIGRDYSNIDKMMVYNPDIIKINHQMLNNLNNSNYQTTLIHNITKIAHEMGILVISTGIETQEHLIDAVKSGAQLLQGFYLSPTTELDYDSITDIINSFDRDMVFDLINAEHAINAKNVIVNVVTFNTKLRNAIDSFDIKQLNSYATTIMNKYSFIESGYLLNKEGIQISKAYINKETFGSRNKELFGLYNKGFNHSDEEVFYRLQSPILTDWTIKPFRSRLTNELCVTGSFKVGTEDEPFIVVLNFDYIKFEAYLNKQKAKPRVSLLSN